MALQGLDIKWQHPIPSKHTSYQHPLLPTGLGPALRRRAPPRAPHSQDGGNPQADKGGTAAASEQSVLSMRPGDQTGVTFNGKKIDVSQAAEQAEPRRPLPGVTRRASGP